MRTDAAFAAWTSGDLEEMMKALQTKTNLIDRHFLLMTIVDTTYKRRKEHQMAEKCLEIGRLHLKEFPDIAPALEKEMGGTLPRVTTFQRLATLLAETGDLDEAIAVCRRALSFGLIDGTKGGFEGRIARLEKQKGKHEAAT